jgi:hypothetical protein
MSVPPRDVGLSAELAKLVVVLDERGDLVGDGLVDAPEREHFRHVTLAFEPHQGWAMADARLWASGRRVCIVRRVWQPNP